jgi:hypothetical protein
MITQYDGTMAHCCEDTYGAFNLGNVYQSSIGDLWFSEVHAKTIHDLIAGRREKYALCRQFPLSPTSPSLDGQKIEISRRWSAVTPESVR